MAISDLPAEAMAGAGAFNPWAAGITGGADLISTAFQNQQAQHLANQAQSFDLQQAQFQTMANQQQNIESQQYNAIQAEQARQFSAGQQLQAEQYNTQQVQQQQAYETQMSNTAFQRSRADAIAAGLNPMVLAGMGGASTPSVSAGSISPVSGPAASAGPGSPAAGARGVVAPVRGMMQGLVSNAIQAGQASTLADKMEKEGEAASASGALAGQLKDKATEDTRGSAADADKKRADANVAEAEALNKVIMERAKNDIYRSSPGLLTSSAIGSLINEGAPHDIGGALYQLIQRFSRQAAGMTPTASNPPNAKVLSQSANLYNQE